MHIDRARFDQHPVASADSGAVDKQHMRNDQRSFVEADERINRGFRKGNVELRRIWEEN